MEISLCTPLEAFPGIGPARAKKLAGLGLCTAGDLLRYFPRDYEDRRALSTIRSAMPDQPVCIQAMVAQTPQLSRIR